MACAVFQGMGILEIVLIDLQDFNICLWAKLSSELFLPRGLESDVL